MNTILTLCLTVMCGDNEQWTRAEEASKSIEKLGEKERARLRKRFAALEKRKLANDKGWTEYEAKLKAYETDLATYEADRKAYETDSASYNADNDAHNALAPHNCPCATYNRLLTWWNRLDATHKNLTTRYENLKGRHETLTERHATLTEDEDVILADADAFADEVEEALSTVVTQRDRETLSKNAKSLVDSGRYAPDANGTKCNQFLQDFARDTFGYGGFDGLQANDMVMKMKSDAEWKATEGDTLQERLHAAQQYANEGYLVVIGYQNASGDGHVAVVVPGTEEMSGKWNMELPQTAQAGKSVYSGRHMGYGFGPELKDKVVIYVRRP